MLKKGGVYELFKSAPSAQKKMYMHGYLAIASQLIVILTCSIFIANKVSVSNVSFIQILEKRNEEGLQKYFSKR